MLKKLWLSYLHWYIKYSGFSNKNEKEDLTYFRDKLFISILILTLALSSLSYIPSAIMAIALDKWFVFYIDTIAVLVITFLCFYKGMSFKLKKIIFSINFFLLSFALIIDLGLNGNGTILIFMLSVLMTLYSGEKAGVISVFVTAAFYVIVLLIDYMKWIDFHFFTEFDIEVLFIVFVNNIVFGLLSVFSVSFLIDRLHNALLKENHLQEELIEKHKIVIAAKENAEQSDRLKTAFLANISHEIRTPMYGILGCADLLKSYDINDGDFKEYLSIIESNGNELLDAMTDIMTISKIETGLITINKSTFNISEIVEVIYKSLMPEAKLKKVHFVLNNFIPKKECIVNSDLDKFKVALGHLVENAIKYTPEGGNVVLSCDLDTDESQIQFMLKDTGIGIPEDKIETIFNPFYQVDVDNKNALHGSGIGLSISKAYVEMLGGDLILESKVGEGTTFLFNIDIDLKEKASQS